jgi:hypothetical protein
MLALGPDVFAELNAAQSDLVFGQGGMDAARTAALEDELAFAFPSDLKFLLANVIEIESGASPWAALDLASWREDMAIILGGITFDVEHNNLWLRRWGEQPTRLDAALDIARRDVPNWPKLFPLFGHRFLAIEPCLDDNPVFSIVQTDIICYGANLAHYLLLEFGPSRDYEHHTTAQNPRHIELWSDFADDRDLILAWPSGSLAAERAPWRRH